MNSQMLNANPALKAIVTAAFPNYRKTKASISEFNAEHGKNINSYWDGGSRDEYAIVHIATRQRKALPTSTHPFYDLAGVANTENRDVIVDERGNATLKRLPAGFALVQAGTFCGKQATATVYLSPDDTPKLLP
jgi:hypothetical protein